MFYNVESFSYLCICYVWAFVKNRFYPMNSKILYIILLNACWLLSSCDSGEPDGGGKEAGSEMQFVVSELSRASVTSNINVPGSRFAVYGEMKFPGNAAQSPLVIFDKEEVVYNGDRWGYDNIQYWFPEFEYSFIAVHPTSVLSRAGADAQYSNSSLSFTYTVPVSADNVLDKQGLNDIVVATHRRIHKENPSIPATPVGFNFWHTMSRVNFQLENAGAADNVVVNSITLEGVNTTGSFSIAPAPLLSGSRQTDDYVCSWTGISNKRDFIANIAVNVPENEVRPLFPDDDALLMIPQPDNHDVLMQITYTLYDAPTQPEQFTLKAVTPIGGWEQGKVYTYSMAVNELTKEIDLTVSVKDWHSEKFSNVTVPEY